MCLSEEQGTGTSCRSSGASHNDDPTIATATTTDTANNKKKKNMNFLNLEALDELAATRSEQQQQHHVHDWKLERRPSTGTLSTETTSSISTNNSVRSASRVQFNLSSIIIHSVEPSFETDEEKAALWYSKKDIQHATNLEKESVLDYADANPAYMTHLLQIWRTPCTNTEVLDKLVSPIRDSPMRGLEKHCLKAMKQRRGIVLGKVLQAQRDLYFSVMDPNERALLLKDQCQPLCRTSARFARALALGDAAMAAA